MLVYHKTALTLTRACSSDATGSQRQRGGQGKKGRPYCARGEGMKVAAHLESTRNQSRLSTFCRWKEGVLERSGRIARSARAWDGKRASGVHASWGSCAWSAPAQPPPQTRFGPCRLQLKPSSDVCECVAKRAREGRTTL